MTKLHIKKHSTASLLEQRLHLDGPMENEFYITLFVLYRFRYHFIFNVFQLTAEKCVQTHSVENVRYEIFALDFRFSVLTRREKRTKIKLCALPKVEKDVHM